jgi:hypothetical protein
MTRFRWVVAALIVIGAAVAEDGKVDAKEEVRLCCVCVCVAVFYVEILAIKSDVNTTHKNTGRKVVWEAEQKPAGKALHGKG